MALSYPFRRLFAVMSLALCLQAVSQAPQHFWSSKMQATCDGCFARQSYLLGHLSWHWHVQDSTPTGVSGGGYCTLSHAGVGFKFHFHFLQHAQWSCEDDDMFGLIATSWGKPVESMCDFSFQWTMLWHFEYNSIQVNQFVLCRQKVGIWQVHFRGCKFLKQFGQTTKMKMCFFEGLTLFISVIPPTPKTTTTTNKQTNKQTKKRLLLLFTFYNCIVPMGFLPWEIQVAFPWGKPAATVSGYPSMMNAGCFNVSIIHQSLT